MHSSKKIIPVVAGALMRADGAFMLGSRPAGKPYAGYWEFPGGKVEPGESLFDALVREFSEEMGITVTHATPWLTRVHHYEHASVELTFFRIWAWNGEPQSCEGQAFAWQMPGQETVSPMLPANGPILKSLSLPDYCVRACPKLSDAAALLGALPGRALLLVDAPALQRDELAALLQALAPGVHAAGGLLLAKADPAWLGGLPVDGVHLSQQALSALRARPDFPWVGAEVGSAAGLAHAAALALDYACVALCATDVALAGRELDDYLAESIPLPVFADAGRAMPELDVARSHGAHGVVLTQGEAR
ncbi:NUDIX domain-containing protein [Craterilacuibacter sp. RT1T]|uniref:NUDIX domain-containing protein n=1 Tax=Craterilacuibacter sp. RT1T TaxID=2942211 RepID=UPI0020BFE95C|nr:NUDIX domain-containing protein [Craterilacuibacter sp. RT1T]MCL6264223.1 NUDIX domain-containing protein [Craterilacuibacter sp. RT1T]